LAWLLMGVLRPGYFGMIFYLKLMVQTLLFGRGSTAAFMTRVVSAAELIGAPFWVSFWE